MKKSKNHMLRYLETNRDRNIELAKIYQTGLDWKIAHQKAFERVNAKIEKKLL